MNLRTPAVTCPLFLFAIAFVALAPASAQGRRGAPAPEAFAFRFLGPIQGNRVSAVAGIAGDPSTWYAGAASGGVWKSVDGGNRWQPIFDNEDAAAIGALADMRYDPPEQIQLRTVPPQDPHIWEEARFRGRDWRPITHWGMERVPSPMVVPGKYEARLTVDGKTFNEPVTIVMDPHSAGSEADIAASVKLQLGLRDDVSQLSAMVNRIEWVREQLAVQEKMLKADPAETALEQQALKTDDALQHVEYEMVSQPLTASDDKTYISAWKIYYNLLWLAAEIGPGAGDVAGGGDYRPTDEEVAEARQLEQELSARKTDFDRVMTKDFPAFEKAMADHKFQAMPLHPESQAGEQSGEEERPD